MNKKELEKSIKKYLCVDCNFDLYLLDKVVYFSLRGFDNREVCSIEIPYKNRLDKQSIYLSILDLISRFDFSFRVTFETTQEIYKFLEV